MPLYRQYPLVTPDSIRAKLHIDRKLYGTYVDRSTMHTHTNGTKYVGTLENWGSELLVEAHKLKMKYTPFNIFHYSDAAQRYFDFHYGTELNSVYQPNVILGCVNMDNVPQNRCYIQFHSCKRDVILRSTSYSDPDLSLMTYYKTSSPPNFVSITPMGSVTSMQIKVYDESIPAGADNSHDTMYYFNLTATNDTLTIDSEYRRNLIDPDSVESLESGWRFNTLDLQPWMNGQPLIWLSIPTVKTIETGSFVGNYDQYNNPLMTVGIDGHNNQGLYSNVYPDNLPPMPGSYPYDSPWMLKVYAKYDDYSSGNMSSNRSKELRKITFCFYDDTPAFQNIIFTQDITWDTDKFHIYLNTNANRLSKTYWVYHKPVEGDSDYDGMTYHNPSYLFATTPMGEIDYRKACPAKINNKYNPLFIVKTEYHYNENRYLTPRAQTGVHIDFTSDYSDHCVDKKNGTIYDMGDFDGLPNYYKTKNARYVKRGRVSLYTLRDWITTETQLPMKRQSAGLLIDSGLQSFVYNMDSTYLESMIHYKYSPNRTYYTNGTPETIRNVLSDICYVNGNSMVDIHKQKTPYQMIYHGDRFFSVRMLADLGDDEYGRVYVISNDPAEYDNNDNTIYTKPERTLARICDIPTDYRQLTHISGLVSSVITDPYYVRTECCYGDGAIHSVNGNDLQRVWNTTSNENVMVHDNQTRVFDKDINMNADYGSAWMDVHYTRWDNRNAFLEMTNAMATNGVFSEYTWRVADGGSGYKVGAELKDYVGGKPFEAYIQRIDGNGGVVVTRETENTKTVKMNRANFNGRIATYTPSFSDGPMQSDEYASFTLEIEQNAWNDLQPKNNGSVNGCYAFKFNAYDQLTIWKYNPVDRWWYENCVLTGEAIVDTVYNHDLDITKYSTPAVIMEKMLNPQYQLNGYDDATYTDGIPYSTSEIYNVSGSSSDVIIDNGYNSQDALHVIVNDSGAYSMKSYRMIPMNASSKAISLPKSHEAPLYNDIPRMCTLLFNRMNDGFPDMGYVPKQPNVYVYNPYKTYHRQYKQDSSDVVHCIKETPISFIYYPSMTDNGYTIGDIYRYTGHELSNNMKTRYNELIDMSRGDLYHIAITLNPTLNGETIDENPVQYAEFNGVPYSKERLIQYIMSFDIMNENVENGHVYRPTMTSGSVEKLRDAGELVMEEIGGQVVPVGDQPLGDIVPVTSRDIHCELKLGESSSTVRTKPLYVFRLNDDERIESFDGFHMKDQYSNHDISEKTLLIYQNTLYVYDKNEDTWKHVVRRRA